jgi:molecular chaperone DnaK (HSP70)
MDTVTPDDLVIGIDLGTRFSCCGIWRNRRLEIISDEFGNRTMPSIVSFYKSIRLIGSDAITMKSVNPGNTIYDIKRIIGCKFTDEIITKYQNLLTYKLVSDQTEHNNILIELGDTPDEQTITGKKVFRPEEISAMILTKLKNNAQKYTNKIIKDAVITVPAYFNDAQRQATLDSANIAGLNVLRMINEPTAAALAYGMGSGMGSDNMSNMGDNSALGKNVIVYDLGAGTLDVCLLNIYNGTFQVLGVTGNTFLGGEDFDYRLVNHAIIEFKQKNNLTLSSNDISNLSYLKLKSSAENAKKILSTNDKAIIIVDDFHNGIKLYQTVTRDDFEKMCNDLFVLCIKCLHDVLESSELTRNDIDDVILVGGSTRIPKIQELLLDFFRNTRITKLNNTLNPDEVVAAGASIYGYILSHKEDPFSQNLVLLDVTPLSLGVETLQKQMTIVIPRNTPIPTRKTKTFSTDTDYQTSVTIRVFEGERKLTKDNHLIGTFQLSNFESAPRGFPIIKLTFSIDINGILHITAVEKKSDVQNSIDISSIWGSKGRLSREEIDLLIKEALQNDIQDTIYTKKVDYAYQIDDLCNNVLTNLKDDAFKLTPVDKKKVKLDIKNTLQWMTTQDIITTGLDEYKKILDKLNSVYGPLILKVNKEDDKFTGINAESIGTKIHDDDDSNSNNIDNKYESYSCQNNNDILNGKEELKKMKNNIMELCENISSMIHNPISKLSIEDTNILTDYIDSVLLWICATDANNINDYISKVNQINNFTGEIMSKYDTVFDSSKSLNSRDELELLCIGLHSSIKSNYFSMKETDIKLLTNIIEDAMQWLQFTPNVSNDECLLKLNQINDVCNQIYQKMSMIKDSVMLQSNEESINCNSVSDLPSDEERESNLTSNIIDEKINDIIKTIEFLEVESEDQTSVITDNTIDPIIDSTNNNIYLKVDINKLSQFNSDNSDNTLKMLKK